jgi:hypothetical protein
MKGGHSFSLSPSAPSSSPPGPELVFPQFGPSRASFRRLRLFRQAPREQHAPVQLYRRSFTKHGLPFLFVSGCGSNSLAEPFGGRSMLQKLFVSSKLKDAIVAILGEVDP